jgi:hypothetical protein
LRDVPESQGEPAVDELISFLVQFLLEALFQGLFELPGYVLRWMFGVSGQDDPGDVVAALLGLGFWGLLVVVAIVIWRLVH